MWATSLLTIMLLFPLLSAAPLDIAGGVEGDNAGLHGHAENVTRLGKYFVHNEFDFSVSVEGDVGSIGHEVNIDVHSNTDDHHHHEDNTVIECKEGLSVLFKSIDSNNNGLVDAKELVRVCHQNNIQITESVAVRILTLPDKKVGFNIAKFCELLKNCPSTNSADILYFLLQLYDKGKAEFPLEDCLDMCQSNTCQNDRNVREGCNQMFSCAHGCKLLQISLERGVCRDLCDRNDQSGCSPNVGGWKFDLCQDCNRGGCTKWPQVAECKLGCNFYNAVTIEEQREFSPPRPQPKGKPNGCYMKGECNNKKQDWSVEKRDTWGCANLNSCTDKDACEGRPQKLFEFCDNNEDQPFISRFIKDGQEITFRYPPVLPRQRNIAHLGYPNCDAGWYDVQGQGVKNDYCRWVGDCGCRGDCSFWSCALAGSNVDKSTKGQYTEPGKPHGCYMEGECNNKKQDWSVEKWDTWGCANLNSCTDKNVCKGRPKKLFEFCENNEDQSFMSRFIKDGLEITFVFPPDREEISNAISSTITNPLSKSQKLSSPRSKLLQELPNIVIDLGANVMTKHNKLYKNVFKDLFLKIVANPELDDYFPNFSSAFQYKILPSAIQKEDTNSLLLKSKLKTPFPKAVDDSAQLEHKEVLINGTYVDKCRFYKCWGRKVISTDMYAKQGQLATVTIPENVVGKFSIRVGSHTDRVFKENKYRWLKNKKIKRPGAVVQYYGKKLLKQKTRLLTPYGGLIYITIQAPIELGNFKLKFENVLTSPRFKYGKTTNEEWSKMLASSESPMIEIDIPGVIVTIPRSYRNRNIDSLNMERLTNEYTKMMKAFFKMQGYEMPRPHRYVYDVAISHGLAHAGYPVVSNGVSSELFELADKTDGIWVIPHELGHNIQQSMWTPAGLGETTNNIFAQYINEKVYNANFPWVTMASLKFAVKFKEGGKKFSSLSHAEFLNIFKMVQQECTWEVYIKFFKYYNEEIPKASIPKTKETKYSTIAKVLSEKCNKNLIPFFKWWKWPVTTETEEATKKLPKWDGIIDILNKADTEGALRRCYGIDSGCCTKENPCKENDGDCDSNDDCLGDLVCGKDNCGKEGFWNTYDDCCKAADGFTSSAGILDPAGCKKESDVDYYGFDIGTKKTSGEKECAEFCSSKRCQVWSLRKSDGWCRIIHGEPYKISRDGFVSGNKQCGFAGCPADETITSECMCGGKSCASGSVCASGSTCTPGKSNGCYMKGECNNKKQDWSVEKRDTWGCANLNSCTDEDKCKGRPQKLFEFCENNDDQPFMSRFMKDGLEITFIYPEGKSNGCYMKGECNNNKQDWSVEKRDTWGCANLNSCTDKDACEGRPKKLFEFCENNEDQPFMSRFIKDGLEITFVYPEVEDCSEDVLLRVCSCPRLNIPVCADGEFYGNLCIYQCAKKKATCEGQLDFPELEECNF